MRGVDYGRGERWSCYTLCADADRGGIEDREMNRDNVFETILSAIVVLVAVGFLLFAYSSTGGAALSDYKLTVVMGKADGLAPGSDVQIAGVKVGSVSDLTLSGSLAVAHIRIQDGVKIPKDSSLSISSALMSSPYLSISPGHSADMVMPGGSINSK
jgi:phospholipid/cholesterol/gamma-HCH transport system substrate-binding protein